MWKEEQPPEVFFKKVVLTNFAKFTGKHLCQILFFNKVAGQASLVDASVGYQQLHKPCFWQVLSP